MSDDNLTSHDAGFRLDSPAYRDAFRRYMRTGAPISPEELKAREERPTTHYIWRTQGDSRVRSTHQANDGKIFAWDDPPPTGHPGDEPGCRCWAEAYYPELQEYARQTLVSAAADANETWEEGLFVQHYSSGRGRTVTLQDAGHLRGVIDHYANTLGIYDNVNRQIAEAARDRRAGAFRYDFGRSYDFGSYRWYFGGGTVSGSFSGTVDRNSGVLRISGSVRYAFRDRFTDPAGIRQRLFDTSDQKELEEAIRSFIAEAGDKIGGQRIDRWLRLTLNPLYLSIPPEIRARMVEFVLGAILDGLSPARIAAGLVILTDFPGIAYDIVGDWETHFEGAVYDDRVKSRYVWP